MAMRPIAHLLQEAVGELRGEAAPPPTTSVGNCASASYLRLRRGYIPEETLRLAVYRRVRRHPYGTNELGIL